MCEEDLAELLNNNLSPKDARGIRMRTPKRDPDAMFQILMRVYGLRQSLPELTVAFYNIVQGCSEKIEDFMDRLYAAYEDVITKQAIQRVPLMDNTMLRNYIIYHISDSMVHVTLKERVIQATTVSLIDITQKE